MSLVALPNVQANTWAAKPLVNCEDVLIETPGSWEIQNSNGLVEQYYDPAHGMTVMISVVSKQDMSTASLKQLSQNSVEILRQSLKNVEVVRQEELIRNGQSRIVTEVQGEGANQMVLHYILNHIDFGDRWIEIRFLGFPSQIEAARDTIKRFMNSLQTRS